MVAAGLLAVFATYWDEAWHTDIGRDTAWAAPHVLLYGSVAVVGLGVAYWGIRQLFASRSLPGGLRNRPLTAAGFGALGALVAAPVDTFWHETYGRDAVLWSPPHMLALLGAIALGLGLAAGIPSDRSALRAGAGILLLANAVAVVFEYEADVPQFNETLYLPIVVAVSVGVAFVVDQLVPGRFGVAVVAVGYAVTRLAVAGALAALGRSTPDLPVAVLGLAFWCLPLRTRVERVAAAAAGVSGLALIASAMGAASEPTSAVASTAVPIVGVALLVLLAGRTRLLAAAAVVTAGVVMPVVPDEPASAHDPGQGDPVIPVELTGRGGGGQLTIAASVSEHCDDLEPVRVVARRAGDALTAPLTETTEGCTFRGAVAVPSGGRWFTYVEFRHEGQALEAWLPLDADSDRPVTQDRDLYLPAGGGQGVTVLQAGVGVLIYLVGFGLIAVGVAAIRQEARESARRNSLRASLR